MPANPFLLTSKLRLPTIEDWQEFHGRFGLRLPQYEDYLNTYGEGTYSNAVRVYPPRRVLSELAGFQQRWQKYFLWDAADTELSPGDLEQAVIVCDSLDGDEVVHVPTKAGLYILPRHRYSARRIGSDLDDAIHYICDSGNIYSDIGFRVFESRVDRARINFRLGEARFDFARTLESLSSLAHIDLAVSEAEDYICVTCPSIEGSVGVIGEVAFIKHDNERTPEKETDLLMSLGYTQQNT